MDRLPLQNEQKRYKTVYMRNMQLTDQSAICWLVRFILSSKFNFSGVELSQASPVSPPRKLFLPFPVILIDLVKVSLLYRCSVFGRSTPTPAVLSCIPQALFLLLRRKHGVFTGADSGYNE